MAKKTSAKPAPEEISMEDIFGEGGLLEKCHSGYEYRGSQLAMAQAVEEAFAKKRHAIVEAGTGTGKTLAYLIPAIRSGRRVVISTATKALQEQLFTKDVPFIQEHFAPNLKVALMKGRGNFLCLQKAAALEGQPVLKDMEEIDWFSQIRDWSHSTDTGDRVELGFLPDDSDLWHRLDARRDTCTGKKCPDFDRCFLTRMQQRAAAADLIIVNHALFFADLALKQDDFGSIIPEYSAVIFDEAHEIEDVASDYFGRKTSERRFDDLARDAEQAMRTAPAGQASPALLRRATRLKEKARAFFESFPEKEGRYDFPPAERTAFRERNGDAYDELVKSLRGLETELAALPSRTDELGAISRRAAELRDDVAFLIESEEKSYVYWYERRGKNVFLTATPIDVSGILRERLFAQFDTVILTSATLAVGRKFEFLRQRLGVEMALEKVLDSEFDFQSQAILYIPTGIPDVRDAGFINKAAQEVMRILEVTKGRAFCLFTSYTQMREIYERVRPRIPYPTFLQGNAPRPVLLERFRTTPNAVLFATSSFWQGVDVPGEALSCVIIDRLPFAVPSDPVVSARVRAVNEDGRNAFLEYQVPEAVLALKQGFGRLVRSRKDRGVLVLLDDRISRMRYGQVFLDSLPQYSRTRDLEEVERFMSASDQDADPEERSDEG
jgi:ATP-dependent DNA helicase DinG